MLLLEDYPQYNTNNLKILQKRKERFYQSICQKLCNSNYWPKNWSENCENAVAKVLAVI